MLVFKGSFKRKAACLSGMFLHRLTFWWGVEWVPGSLLGMLLSCLLPSGLCQGMFVGFWIHLGFLPTPRPSMGPAQRGNWCLVYVTQ